jgi:hypothetical protein
VSAVTSSMSAATRPDAASRPPNAFATLPDATETIPGAAAMSPGAACWVLANALAILLPPWYVTSSFPPGIPIISLHGHSFRRLVCQTIGIASLPHPHRLPYREVPE